jgi:hypothetical protein
MDNPADGKKKSSHKKSQSESIESIDQIMDSWSNDIDSLGLLLEEIKCTYLSKIRQQDCDLADDLERQLTQLTSEGHYGVGISGYTKVNVIRPTQRKYRK